MTEGYMLEYLAALCPQGNCLYSPKLLPTFVDMLCEGLILWLIPQAQTQTRIQTLHNGNGIPGVISSGKKDRVCLCVYL